MDEVEPEMDGSRVFKTTGGAKSRKGDRRTPNLLIALQNPNTLGGQSSHVRRTKSCMRRKLRSQSSYLTLDIRSNVCHR